MAFLLTPHLFLAQEAQRSLSTHTYDLHGRPVEGPRVTEVWSRTTRMRTESVRSLNGRLVPLEQFEERLVAEGPGGRIIERILRRFDANGNPGPPEKTRLEERKNPDGSIALRAEVYQGDWNGRFTLREVSETVTQKSGDQTASETLVRRPGLNGSLPVVQKAVTKEIFTNGRTDRSVSTFRLDASGKWVEAHREKTLREEKELSTREETTQYELGPAGQFQIAGRSVRTVSRAPDKSETELVEIFSVDLPGRAGQVGSNVAKLKEQHRIERRPGNGDTVVETISVRRPPLDGSPPSGPFQKISERVCTGACRP